MNNMGHKRASSGDLPPDAPDDAARAEFGRRLQQAIIKKGWHQSELARQSSMHMPRGEAITRDMISKYIRAKTFPSPRSLDAIAKALKTRPDELLPTRGVSNGDVPPFDMRGLQDGNVWLRVNQAATMEQAAKIMRILAEDRSS